MAEVPGAQRPAAPHVGRTGEPVYRNAVAEDVAECIVLRGRTRENAVSVERLQSLGITAQSWSDEVSNGASIGEVCHVGGQLVGYCFGACGDGEILVLALLPEHEQRGIGRALLSRVVARLAALGHRRLFLGCSDDPRSRSHGFYRHLGWRSTGQIDGHGDELLELHPPPAPAAPRAELTEAGAIPLHPQALDLPFGAHRLIGDRLTPPGGLGTVLLLHGGGSSTGEGFGELRRFLLARGLGSVAFDFVGHGRTGGAQLGSTLSMRVAQVMAVVQALGLDPARLSLAGFSMGAYVAACAADQLAPAGLCLAIPAAYHPAAFDRPFGPAFSKVLRQPRSWALSDAFERVSRYRGHLLVLSAGDDRIVPAEIPDTYFARAVQAASREHHCVQASAHDLSAHYAAHPTAREQAYAAVARMGLRAAGVAAPI